MRKRFLGLLVGVVTLLGLAFVLFGCGSKEEGKVNVFIYNNADAYITTVRTDLKAKLDAKGVDSLFHDAGNDQTKQNTQIDSAIAAGASVLVVNIVTPGSADVVIQKAKAANLPVIFFNREVSDEHLKAYDKAAFIGTRAEEAGELQGDMIGDELVANWSKWDRNNDGKISYIMLRADADNAEANGRTKYSVEFANAKLKAAGKAPLEQLGADLQANWDTAKAKQATDNAFSANGIEKIELIIANNDGMAIGALQALQEKNYNVKGGDQKTTTLLVGVDATEDAQTHVKDGVMFGTIKQDAQAMASAILDFAVNAKKGGVAKDFVEGTSLKYVEGKVKVQIPYAKFTK